MDPQLLELASIFERECRYVISSSRLPTKVRFELTGDYTFDLFYRSSKDNYSYTLLQGERRIIGWDNAPHHRGLDNFPHHFHSEIGEVQPSRIGSNPVEDIGFVARQVNAFLEERLAMSPRDT